MTAEARKLTLDRYRDHEIRILICCTALDEGLDVPDTGYAVVVSGNSTLRQRVQRLGRILRRSENKRLAGLYYLYLDRTMEDPVYLERTQIKSADNNSRNVFVSAFVIPLTSLFLFDITSLISLW